MRRKRRLRYLKRAGLSVSLPSKFTIRSIHLPKTLAVVHNTNRRIVTIEITKNFGKSCQNSSPVVYFSVDGIGLSWMSRDKLLEILPFATIIVGDKSRGEKT